MDKDYKLGYLGECYVILELAKRNMFSTKLHDRFDFDLITNNGLRIEVKTAKLSEKYYPLRKDGNITIYNRWIFRNGGKVEKDNISRNCDFYIFVCLDILNNPIKYFIIPSKIVDKKQTIAFPHKSKKYSQWSDFENKWDLIK